MSLNGSFNGEKASKSHSLSNSLSANRITEDWKIKLNTNLDYQADKIPDISQHDYKPVKVIQFFPAERLKA